MAVHFYRKGSPGHLHSRHKADGPVSPRPAGSLAERGSGALCPVSDITELPSGGVGC